jgi:hypothetical protein
VVVARQHRELPGQRLQHPWSRTHGDLHRTFGPGKRIRLAGVLERTADRRRLASARRTRTSHHHGGFSDLEDLDVHLRKLSVVVAAAAALLGSNMAGAAQAAKPRPFSVLYIASYNGDCTNILSVIKNGRVTLARRSVVPSGKSIVTVVERHHQDRRHPLGDGVSDAVHRS